jgi:cobalamin biosynthetic protein CobC
LADIVWQANARERLAAAGQRLGALLGACGDVTATPLYATLTTPQAPQLHAHLLSHGILNRHFEQADLLRCGLPGGEGDWQRLAGAVNDWKAR